MKASELTNEELANRLEVHAVPVMGCVGSSKTGGEIAGDIREAAARLRNVTVRTDNSAVIAELQRRLKVAEDALESAWMYADKLPHQWPLPKMVKDRMKNALAAIREEGGAE